MNHRTASVAAISIDFGLASLAVLRIAGVVAYREEENRQGWRAIAFRVPLVFLAEP